MDVFLKIGPVRLWQARMIELHAKDAYWRKLDLLFPDGEENFEVVVERVSDPEIFFRVLARILDERTRRPRFDWDVSS